MNQYGPQGNVTYAQNGTWPDGTPKFTQTTSLSPEQQAIYNTGVKTQQNLADLGLSQSQTVGNVLANQFNTNGLPSAGNANIAAPKLQTSLGTNDYSADRQKVEDALMQRLNPQLDRDRAQLDAKLANQGIKVGSTAYTRAQEDFGRQTNDARLAAILGAGDEQNRMQTLALNAANFGNNALQQNFGNQQTLFNLGNTARNQALNERLLTRNQALNENIGLATGSQVQMPQFGGTPQTGVAGTDVAGINANAYNGAMNAYGQQMGQWNNTMGGLFGLGANALLAFSDERLKTDIEDTGAEVGGVPVKTWRWKGTNDNGIGVVAQELEKKHPELVDKTHPSGFRRVDYGGLFKLGATAKARAA